MTPPRRATPGPGPSRPRAVLPALLLAGALLTGCSGDGSGDRTAVVFTPEQPLDRAGLQQAAAVLAKRASKAGLQDVRSQIGKGSVEVSASGPVGDKLARLAERATLSFRPVHALTDTYGGVTGTVPAELQSAFDALTCPAELRPPSLAAPAVACGHENRGRAPVKFALAPSALGGNHVTEVQARDSGDGSEADWVVTVKLSPAGSKVFGDLTADLAEKGAPTDQLAVVLDGQVVSSLAILVAIRTESMDIGNLTKDDALELADGLSGGSLPGPMKVSRPELR
ncbi:hypothetical protein [Kitasatospora sp. NPDC051914]|uniref:SecDF P1 head subdomain-containing protein n=1 Tax=Kitasatospora sp. NPDC051914 TaxID=3154945 RepID=UPI0034407773